jgi:hypothetical protein
MVIRDFIFSERFADEIYQSPEMLTVNRDEFVNVVQAGLESDAEKSDLQPS